MKINFANNNPAFNGILVSNGYKSPKQIEIIENITECILEHPFKKTLVSDLEKKNTDIFISANSDGNTVDLKLLSHAGLYYNFVPFSNNGERISNKIGSLVHDRTISKREVNRNNFKVENFIIKASEFDVNNENNQREIKIYDAITEKDMMNNVISKPEIIPDARCVLGNKQITTRDFVKRHYGTK